MTTATRRHVTPRALLVGAVLVALAGAPDSAGAYWPATGLGSGSGLVASMPAGNQPSGAAAGQNVTVSWTQSSFLSGLLGSFSGGGYTVARYAASGSTPVTTQASCAGTISGAAASLQCVEAGVPYGAWQYSVTPVLGASFTGAESARSATVTVATAAPSLTAATAQNPATGDTTGAISLAWGTVSGATGYNVYRRTSAGSFDFNSPLNGATPVSATTYSDPGTGLTGGTTYFYVVRALAGSPAVESASSNAQSATAIARPAAPAGAVTATATAGAQIGVTWSSVSGVAGYNVYRRTSAGAYNFASPLNGATPVTPTSYTDTTGVNGTTYLYTVRAVITGAAGAQVESANSAESNSATADSSPPPAPTAVSVTSGGNVLGALTCTIASGTRYINNAGKASVGVTATIAAPEAGQTVVFSATSPGSTPVTATVAAGSTSVSTSLNLTSLLDGTVTLTARTKDSAGNLSATLAPTNTIIKDVVAGALSNLNYVDRVLSADQITGTSECGATVLAHRTVPGSSNFSLVVGSGGTFTLNVAASALAAYSYDVTATDLAGNASAIIVVSGSTLL
jgi:hypothetical protein